jgi:poly(3-hydroxybutyrate) depolymerase
MTAIKSWAILVVLLLFAATAAQSQTNEHNSRDAPLANIKIDSRRVAVAGISSGAFMSTQLQLAYPEIFPRASILAGGPYDCALVTKGMIICLYPKTLSDEDINAAVDRAMKKSYYRLLGDFKQLAHGNVYVLYGTEDKVVGTQIAGSVTQFYEKLQHRLGNELSGMQIAEDGTRKFGHTFPTYLAPAHLPVQFPPGYDDCIQSISPYLGHCQFDAAKNILEHLYPEITTGPEPVNASGAILQLPSASYGATNAAFAGKTLYVYKPKTCFDGKPCGMLVVLHGCNQNDSAIGQTFVRDVGFNRWAGDYHLIVVYPQTRTAPENFGGCWDWWGYTGNHFDTRGAPQILWLARLSRKLTGQSRLTQNTDR